MLFELVDRAEYAVALELVEFVPYDRVLDPGLRPDDAILIDIIEKISKDREEGKEI